MVATLRELPQAAVDAHFTNPSVIVVGKVASLHDKLNWFEQKPLLGKSIVVTRAREQASSLARSLSGLGAEVIQCPTIEIRALPDYAELDAAVARLADYGWLIFTSVNGVRHFWQRLEAAGKDSRALGACKEAAIGRPRRTPCMSAASGRFRAERYVAEGVVEGLLAREGGKLAGHAHAAAARGQSPRRAAVELGKAGATVDVIPAYETVPAAGRKDEVLARLEEGSLSCVTFGSSSTVENFLNLIPAEKLKAHPETMLAAIGPVTAETLRKHGLDCRIQPGEYTIPALVDAITQHFTRA